MITMENNDSSTPTYEEVKEELKIDPAEQTASKDRLDGIVASARRS